MDDSLEALLEKATNPKNRYEDWEFIMAFCDRVNGDADGPQTALRIIVPKIRSTNEKVSLLALTLLEACVKNCGKPFHQELGKFRFLNEMIRMISPKYLANETSENTKKKVKELMYSWKLGLPHEPKISEAYEMLKKQGLVFDESVPRDPTLDLSSNSKPTVSLQQDPRQSEILNKLLHSKNPEDLRAANRLIREMVRRDEKRMDKLKKRLDDLELIQNNIKLLNELLSHYRPESSEHEKQLIQELHSSVEKMRPQLFKMAGELRQDEEGMTDILQINDSLIRVLDKYKRVMVNGDTQSGPGGGTSSSAPSENSIPSAAANSATATDQKPVTEESKAGGGGDLLIELADLNFGNPSLVSGGSGAVGEDFSLLGSAAGGGLLDDLPSGTEFGLVLPPVTATTSSVLPSLPPLNPLNNTGLLQSTNDSTGSADVDLLSLGNLNFGLPQTVPTTISPMNAAKFPSPLPAPAFQPQPVVFPPPLASVATIPPVIAPLPMVLAGTAPNQADPLVVLDNLFVARDSLQPSAQTPLPLMSKNGITASLCFTKFQAAVPKVMRVKLQPPTGTELASYNPILPPSSVSQVLLLANPTKEKIRLRFRFSFMQNGQETVEVGEASDFPSV